jgi:hypothetical protein
VNVRILDINGSTDGLRWGEGRHSSGRRGVSTFAWRYDILNDVMRLWVMASHTGSRPRQLRNKALAAAARLLVRERVGLA